METCAECGKPINTSDGSYYVGDPFGKGAPGKSYHSACGDPFGAKARDVKIAKLKSLLDTTLRLWVDPRCRLADEIRSELKD